MLDSWLSFIGQTWVPPEPTERYLSHWGVKGAGNTNLTKKTGKRIGPEQKSVNVLSDLEENLIQMMDAGGLLLSMGITIMEELR